MWVSSSSSPLLILFLISFAVSVTSVSVRRGAPLDETPTYLWPLPAEYTAGNQALGVDPALKLIVAGNGGGSAVIRAGFERYRGIVFQHTGLELGFSFMRKLRERLVSAVSAYDVDTLKITVHSDNEELQLGVDESYTLLVPKAKDSSQVTIEANTVYGALRGLEVCKEFASQSAQTVFFFFFLLYLAA